MHPAQDQIKVQIGWTWVAQKLYGSGLIIEQIQDKFVKFNNVSVSLVPTYILKNMKSSEKFYVTPTYPMSQCLGLYLTGKP